MFVRRLVYGMGYRYRLHGHDLPGRPDLTFRSRKKVIFVHGCFWHQHADRECNIAHSPRSNLEYWGPKLRRNQERDEENQTKLHEAGWQVLTLWECELKNTPTEELASRVKLFLDGEHTAHGADWNDVR